MFHGPGRSNGFGAHGPQHNPGRSSRAERHCPTNRGIDAYRRGCAGVMGYELMVRSELRELCFHFGAVWSHAKDAKGAEVRFTRAAEERGALRCLSDFVFSKKRGCNQPAGTSGSTTLRTDPGHRSKIRVIRGQRHTHVPARSQRPRLPPSVLSVILYVLPRESREGHSRQWLPRMGGKARRRKPVAVGLHGRGAWRQAGAIPPGCVDR